MVEERSLQLAPPPGVAALDPLMQLQQNLAALNQVNQAIGETLQWYTRVFPLLPSSKNYVIASSVHRTRLSFSCISRGQHCEAGAAGGG